MRIPLQTGVALRQGGSRTYGQARWVTARRLCFTTHAPLAPGDSTVMQVALPGTYDTVWAEVEIDVVTLQEPGAPVLCVATIGYLPQADRARLDRWLEAHAGQAGGATGAHAGTLELLPEPVPVPVESLEPLEDTPRAALPQDATDWTADASSLAQPRGGGRAAISVALRTSLQRLDQRRTRPAVAAHLRPDGASMVVSWDTWGAFAADWRRSLRYGRLRAIVAGPTPPPAYRLTLELVLPDGVASTLLARCATVDGARVMLAVRLTPAFRARAQEATEGR